MTNKEKAMRFKEGKAFSSNADVIAAHGDEITWYYKRRVIAMLKKGALQLFVSADTNEMKRCVAIIEAFKLKARIVPAILTDDGGLVFGCLEINI